jgi:hypothetical protein
VWCAIIPTCLILSFLIYNSTHTGVSFEIKLILGTLPIHKSLYQIAPKD